MKKVLTIYVVLLFSVIIFSVFSSSLLESLSDTLDEDKQAEKTIETTTEIKGKIIESENKSYKKEKPSILFIGGGEQIVENYVVKLQEKDGSVISLNINDKDEFLKFNKGNKVHLVIDNQSNKVIFNLNNHEEKEYYSKLKNKTE